MKANKPMDKVKNKRSVIEGVQCFILVLLKWKTQFLLLSLHDWSSGWALGSKPLWHSPS